MHLTSNKSWRDNEYRIEILIFNWIPEFLDFQHYNFWKFWLKDSLNVTVTELTNN